MTFEVFKYSVRGLYEADKLTFTLLLALKIDMQAQKVRPEEFSILIKGKCGKHCTKLSEYAEENLKRKSFWVKKKNSRWMDATQFLIHVFLCLWCTTHHIYKPHLSHLFHIHFNDPKKSVMLSLPRLYVAGAFVWGRTYFWLLYSLHPFSSLWPSQPHGRCVSEMSDPGAGDQFVYK